MLLMIKLVPKLYQKVKCFRFLLLLHTGHWEFLSLIKHTIFGEIMKTEELSKMNVNIQTCQNVPQTTHLHISIPTLFYMLVLIRASLHGVQRLCPLLVVLKPNRSTRQASSTILQLKSKRLGAIVWQLHLHLFKIDWQGNHMETTEIKKETDRKRGMET